MAHFTEAQRKRWLNNLPGKPLIAKAIFFDEAGRVLMAKPTYKPGWALIGGTVEVGESPMQALLRETQEEIGLALVPGRFTFRMLHYATRIDVGHDHVHIIFSTMLTKGECAAIVIDSKELEEFAFVDPAKIGELWPSRVAQAVTEMLQHKLPFSYAENGKCI